MALLTFFEKVSIPTYDDPAQLRFGEVSIDYEKCTGCLLCVKLCPGDALESKDKKPVLKKPGRNECMACGNCTAFCSEDAIVLTKSLHCNSGKYKTLEQGELSPPRL